MRRLGLLVLFLVVIGYIGLLGFRTLKEKVRKDLSQPVAYPSVTVAPTVKVAKAQNETISLFVPYWTLKSEVPSDFDEYIYFGIAPTSNGINKDEAGFTNIADFESAVPRNAKKLLTLRMVDNHNNLTILKDSSKQKLIIKETIAFAKEHQFDGVVLNLELTAIPFDSLIKQINDFTKEFYKAAKQNKQRFVLTIYGDTFYRLRPFDVKTVANNSDSIFIMAYDFHKSKGNPGPNFPLNGQNIYGYDIAKMIDDFSQFVPARKITIIFGMYGYDWVVDGVGKSIERGDPVTNSEINNTFLTDCSYTNCSVKRDAVSSETEIRYTDENEQRHRIWFEDMESVLIKKKYLKERGISSFSFWANSYF